MTNYERLEYIESSGTQYIDTGVIPNQDTKIRIDVKCSTVSTSQIALFGSRSDSFQKYISCKSTTGYGLNYGKNTSAEQNISFEPTTRSVITLDKNSMIIGESSVTAEETTFTIEGYPMYLCAINDWDYGGARYLSSIKIYSCQIYDNETLVRDFIPCITINGEVGLWDKVSDSFYGNSGTGTFIGKRFDKGLSIGYTQLEYIESSGTQYIDTGFKPNQDTRVITEIICPPSNEAVWAFGARAAVSKDMFCFVYSNSTGSYRPYYGTSLAELSSKYNSTDVIIVDLNKNIVKINNEIVYTHTEQSFTAPVNLSLFACNTNGTVSCSSIRMHSCQIYDNNILVRDFVPAMNPEGELGLWDKVGNKFYTNSGTGTFIGKKKDKIFPIGYAPLEYIESTGTQYIDLGISVPHASEKIIIDFTPTDVGTDNVITGHAADTWSWATNVAMILNSNFLVANTTVPSVTLNTPCLFEYTSSYAKVNNGSKATLSTLTYTDGYNNTLLYASTKYGKHKVRSYKLYNDEILVRNLIPCKNESGAIGMFDTVENKFYGNSGTGVFVAGELPQVDLDYIIEYNNIDGLTFDKELSRWYKSAEGYTLPIPNLEGYRGWYTNQYYLGDKILSILAGSKRNYKLFIDNPNGAGLYGTDGTFTPWSTLVSNNVVMVSNDGVLSTDSSMDDAGESADLLVGKLIIPNNITKIKEYSFLKAKLTEVIIPNSVITISEHVFDSCKSLTKVTLSESLSKIEIGVFNNCTSLTDIIIPNSVTTIHTYAFYGCSNLTLTIPLSVTEIGYEAFYNVPTVYYDGTATGSPWGALEHIGTILITFQYSLDASQTWTAPEGITWGEWVNTSYNDERTLNGITGKFFITSENVKWGNSTSSYGVYSSALAIIYSTDEITSQTYTHSHSGDANE